MISKNFIITNPKIICRNSNLRLLLIRVLDLLYTKIAGFGLKLKITEDSIDVFVKFIYELDIIDKNFPILEAILNCLISFAKSLIRDIVRKIADSHFLEIFLKVLSVYK